MLITRQLNDHMHESMPRLRLSYFGKKIYPLDTNSHQSCIRHTNDVTCVPWTSIPRKDFTVMVTLNKQHIITS
jgi:hypothetical protein